MHDSRLGNRGQRDGWVIGGAGGAEKGRHAVSRRQISEEGEAHLKKGGGGCEEGLRSEHGWSTNVGNGGRGVWWGGTMRQVYKE